jgi:hypothetical protein
MAVILMILTVYVNEQGVWVGDISYFWATKVWNHRQHTEHIQCVPVSLYSAVPYKRFVNKSIQAITPTCALHSVYLR